MWKKGSPEVKSDQVRAHLVEQFPLDGVVSINYEKSKQTEKREENTTQKQNKQHNYLNGLRSQAIISTELNSWMQVAEITNCFFWPSIKFLLLLNFSDTTMSMRPVASLCSCTQPCMRGTHSFLMKLSSHGPIDNFFSAAHYNWLLFFSPHTGRNKITGDAAQQTTDNTSYLFTWLEISTQLLTNADIESVTE